MVGSILRCQSPPVARREHGVEAAEEHHAARDKVGIARASYLARVAHGRADLLDDVRREARLVGVYLGDVAFEREFDLGGRAGRDDLAQLYAERRAVVLGREGERLSARAHARHFEARLFGRRRVGRGRCARPFVLGAEVGVEVEVEDGGRPVVAVHPAHALAPSVGARLEVEVEADAVERARGRLRLRLLWRALLLRHRVEDRQRGQGDEQQQRRARPPATSTD